MLVAHAPLSLTPPCPHTSDTTTFYHTTTTWSPHTHTHPTTLVVNTSPHTNTLTRTHTHPHTCTAEKRRNNESADGSVKRGAPAVAAAEAAAAAGQHHPGLVRASHLLVKHRESRRPSSWKVGWLAGGVCGCHVGGCLWLVAGCVCGAFQKEEGRLLWVACRM